MVGPQQFRGLANFSTFLLDRSSGVLFLGARDGILAVDTHNLAKQPHTIVWDVPEEKRRSCVAKGKTEGDCNNYIRLLEFLGDGQIYACGTYAFDPQCAFLNMSSFSLERWEDERVRTETGKGKCPFEPSQHYTAVVAGNNTHCTYTHKQTNKQTGNINIEHSGHPEVSVLSRDATCSTSSCLTLQKQEIGSCPMGRSGSDKSYLLYTY
ncbi:semaphorin-4F-like [Salmo salar]|uniref:Semaphorin-4F-like n=1 Tax=Salmo salar TaxID=8030 RepID=A0ABM3F3G0_SALSA|nr:semaphorin-4F-like [Salmo salar]